MMMASPEKESKNGSDCNIYLKQCASHWWKLKLEVRRAHSHLMKIQLLSPFLFGRVYQKKLWKDWAISAGLLPLKKVSMHDQLSFDDIKKASMLGKAMSKLQEEMASQMKGGNMTKFLLEIMQTVDACKQYKRVTEALLEVNTKPWFLTVRKKLVRSESQSELKFDAALFLAAWQVSYYVKSIYNGENPLDKFEKDSNLDEGLFKKKQLGNEHFYKEEYSKASKFYTAILDVRPCIHVLYGNRAACYLKLKEYRLAMADGIRATTLEPKWDKGQYRYAQALYELGKHRAALKVLSKAIQICDDTMKLQEFEYMVSKKIYEEWKSGDKSKPRMNVKDIWSDKTNSSSSEDDGMFRDLPDLIDSSSESEGEAGLPSLVADSEDEEECMSPEAKRLIENHKIKHKILKEERLAKKLPKKFLINSLLEEDARKGRMKNNSLKNVKPPRELSSHKVPSDEKKPTDVATRSEPKPEVESHNDLQLQLKKGSLALMDKQPHLAVKKYAHCEDLIMSNKDLHYSPEFLSVFMYAQGVAYHNAGTNSELNKSLEYLYKINIIHAELKFPLPHYMIGRVLLKQNRYSEAVEPLLVALEIDACPNHLSDVNWPGLDGKIVESINGKLKPEVDALLELCRNPPKPDAICRYISCSNRTTVIYFCDPDFRGFVRVVCTTSCVIEYHSACWKKLKTEKNLNSEKDILSGNCFTPDCSGNVKHVRIYDSPDGNCKHFSMKNEEEKFEKQTKQSIKKGKEKQTKKKTYSKENKRKTTSEEPDAMIKSEVKDGAQKINEKQVKTKDLDLHEDVELVEIKPKKEVLFEGKSKKHKVRKQPKQQKVFIDIPYLKHGIIPNEFLESNPPETQSQLPVAPEYDFQPHIIDNRDYVLENFSEYSDLVHDPLGTALHIFSMMEQILEVKGCADVHNSRDIIEFLNLLDDNSRTLIDEVGGLKTLLSKCTTFSFDATNKNVVYLSSEDMFYEVWKDTVYNKSSRGGALSVDSEDWVDVYSNCTENLNPYTVDAQRFGMPEDSVPENVYTNDFKSTEGSSASDKIKKFLKKAHNKCIDMSIKKYKSDRFYDDVPGLIDVSDATEISNKVNPIADDFKSEVVEQLSDFEFISLLDNNPSKKADVVIKGGKVETLEVTHEPYLSDVRTIFDTSHIEFSDGSQDIINEENKIEDKVESISDILNNGTINKAIVDGLMSCHDKRLSCYGCVKQLCPGCFEVVLFNYICVCSDMGNYYKLKENYKNCCLEMNRNQDLVVDLSLTMKDLNMSKVHEINNYLDAELKSLTNAAIFHHKSSIKMLIAERMWCSFDLEKAKSDFVTALETGYVRFVNSQTGAISEGADGLDPTVYYHVTIEDNFDKSLNHVNVEQLCVIEVGIQTDLGRCEVSRRNEILHNTNHALITQRKKAQREFEEKISESNAETEKLTEELMKAKEKIENLKKESAKMQQSQQTEKKKAEKERKDLMSQIQNLNKNNSKKMETKLKAELSEKEKIIIKYETDFNALSAKSRVEKTEHEEIVADLTSCNNALSKRAQKVEMAFLNTNKMNVVRKYNQQAFNIRHITNKMQYWPPEANYQKIRSVWENFKKTFHTAFLKMEAEFAELQNALKSGQSIEDLPPAKYAEPPPLPSTLPTNMSHAELLPVNFLLNSKPLESYHSDFFAQQSQANELKPPATVNNDQTRERLGGSGDYFRETSDLDRLVFSLASSFPNITREELTDFVRDFKRRHGGSLGALKGKKANFISDELENYIQRAKKSPSNYKKSKPHADFHTNKKLPDSNTRQNPTEPSVTTPSKRSRANKSAAWAATQKFQSQNESYGTDEACVICYSEMSDSNSERLRCGHIFHKKCIKSWLCEQRTCPTCREHVLLCDDYPPLSM